MNNTRSFNWGARMLGAMMMVWLAASSFAQNNASAQTARTLTKDSLSEMLGSMGYETEKAGEGVYRITINRDGWGFRIKVGLSSNQQKLWLTSYLGEIPDITKAPANFQTKLLLANDNIGPAYFFMINSDSTKDTPSKKLYLGVPLDNRAITPALLRQELDTFCSIVKETHPLWDVSKWTVVANNTPEPPKTGIK